MRIIIAECSVLYSGRGDTTLGRAIRSIMIKQDGAVSVHNDISNKPLNYMGKDNTFTETIDEDTGIMTWRFDSRKEYIEVSIYKVLADFDQELDDGSVPLVRDGTEAHLQAWLFDNPNIIRKGLTPLEREYQTSAGAIDLMFKTETGLLGVEVKRIAMLGAIDQCVRYRNALTDQHPDTEIEVILTALDVRPNTIKQAEKRKVSYTLVPDNWKDLRNSSSGDLITLEGSPESNVLNSEIKFKENSNKEETLF